MIDMPISGVAGLIGKILDVFSQKVYVYVEVSFGLSKPYALTVVNKSKYVIGIEELVVDPD